MTTLVILANAQVESPEMARRLLIGALACAGSIGGWAATPRVASSTEVGWPTYNNGYDGQRYSPLAEINTGNVATLKRTCVARLGDDGPFQAGPVMANNTLFVTTGYTTVALNATTCAVRWRHVYKPEQTIVYSANRGVALLGRRSFRGTGDGRLLAFDAATGKLLWKVKAADPTAGEFFSSAPTAWNGLLFIGIAGSDWGIRGRMMAFDVATGKERWRWHSIPHGNEPGADTWIPRESAARGGGGFWTTYTLDTAKGELFIPIGNPAPDFNIDPGVRAGANLYTNSLVVLDAGSGKMKWFHQFGANDPWDYDIGAAPLLYEGPDKKSRVAVGSKDGHVYVLDRDTRKVEFKTAVTTVMDNTGKKPTREGTHMCPGALGGVEWNGPALDPKYSAIAVGTVDLCMVFKIAEPQYVRGQNYYGGQPAPGPNDKPRGWVYSIESATGKVRWKYEAKLPVVAAVTPTAGGVTFTGDLGGNFLAFDSDNGKVLLEQNLAASIAGGIVTYAVAGKQYLAVTAGNISRMTFGGAGSPQVIIYTLGLKADEPKVVTAGPAKMPWDITVSKDGKPDAKAGRGVYATFCSACHGSKGEGGVGPSLQGASQRLGFEVTVDRIRNPLPGMPRLPLDEQTMKNVVAYVETLK